MSEPEAHDDWIETHDRLRQVLGDKGQTLIKRTHNGITNAVVDFQMRLETRKVEKLADDAEFLDHILGPIFDKKTNRRYHQIHRNAPLAFTNLAAKNIATNISSRSSMSLSR